MRPSPRSAASGTTWSSVRCRSAIASGTLVQTPVMTSIVDCSSSFFAVGCSPPPPSSSRISVAPLVSSRVSRSTSCSSHSTPRLEVGEALKGICTTCSYPSGTVATCTKCSTSGAPSNRWPSRPRHSTKAGRTPGSRRCGPRGSPTPRAAGRCWGSRRPATASAPRKPCDRAMTSRACSKASRTRPPVRGRCGTGRARGPWPNPMAAVRRTPAGGTRPTPRAARRRPRRRWPARAAPRASAAGRSRRPPPPPSAP